MRPRESQPSPLAHVLSAIVVIVSAPIGGSMWGFAYGNLINGTMDPLGEVAAGFSLGFIASMVLLVFNFSGWIRHIHSTMVRINVIAFGVMVVPIVVLLVVGLLRS